MQRPPDSPGALRTADGRVDIDPRARELIIMERIDNNIIRTLAALGIAALTLVGIHRH
jgi:hypothetical protein